MSRRINLLLDSSFRIRGLTTEKRSLVKHSVVEEDVCLKIKNGGRRKNWKKYNNK